jgi:hypothetical protein
MQTQGLRPRTPRSLRRRSAWEMRKAAAPHREFVAGGGGKPHRRRFPPPPRRSPPPPFPAPILPLLWRGGRTTRGERAADAPRAVGPRPAETAPGVAGVRGAREPRRWSTVRRPTGEASRPARAASVCLRGGGIGGGGEEGGDAGRGENRRRRGFAPRPAKNQPCGAAAPYSLSRAAPERSGGAGAKPLRSHFLLVLGVAFFRSTSHRDSV